MEERKIQLTPVVDTTQSAAGFNEVKQQAIGMAQTVAQAGQTAGKGLDAIGDGAKRAGDGMTREESRIRSAIQRATMDLQTLGQSASQKFAAKIDFQGLDPTKFAPFLAALKEVELAQAQAQASAKGVSFIGDLQGQIAALREQAQLQGQSTEAALRYKAAQLGVGEEASHLITQLTNMRAAQEAIAQAARDEAAAQREAALQATKRSAFLDNLKQQSEAIGKSRADLLQLRAAELGVADAAAPYIAKLREADQANRGFGAGANLSTTQVQGLVHSVKSFFDIVVAGGSPARAAALELGRLSGTFGGTGNALRAIMSLVTPMRVVMLGAAAGVAALGFAMARTESQARQLATVQAQLSATGRADLFSRNGLRDYLRELSLAPGVTRATATSIVSELSKARDIGGAMLKDLGRLAVDFAKATGQDVPAATKALTQAFADPARGAKELDAVLNGRLSSGQILLIERLTRTGEVAKAQAVLFDALRGAVKGLADSSMTPLQRSMNDLGNAWDRAMQSMDKSDGLRTLNALLAKTIQGVAWLIDNSAKLGNIGNLGLNLLPGGAAFTAISRMASEKFVGDAAGTTEKQRTSVGKITGLPQQSVATDPEADKVIKRGRELAAAHRSEAGQIKELTEQRTALNKALVESNRLYGANSEQSKELRDGIAGINKEISEIGKDQRVLDAQLQAKIKAAQDAMAQERDKLAFQEKFLQGQYQVGQVSLIDFYEKKRQAIAAGTAAELAALEGERKAVEEHFAKTRDPGKKEQDRKRLIEISLQEKNVQVRGSYDTILTNQEQDASFKHLNEQLLNYRANLLQLAGDEAGAARLRNQIADEQDRIFQDQTKGRPGAISDADLANAKAQRDQQVALNDAKQQTSLINQRLQIEEDRIALAQSTGVIGEIEALNREGAARAQAVAKMQEQISILEKLSQARPKDLQLKVDVEGFRLQVEKLKASLDPLEEKFRGMFKEAGSNFLSDLMNGTKARDALRNWANNITKPINDMVAKELSGSLFDKGKSFGGAGGFFADLFGGKDRKKPTAGAIDTTDIDQSLSNLRTVGLDPATDALARLQAAADGAAGSLGQGSAGSTPTTGDFTRFDRGQTSGEQSVMDMFRDASKSSEALGASNSKAATAAIQLANAAARGGSALSSLPSIIQSIIAAASASSANGGGGFGGLIGGLMSKFGSQGVNVGGMSGMSADTLAMFGWADGGYTGNRDPRKPAGIVHGEEYVFSAPAVRAIGLQHLERLHQRAKTGRVDGEDIPGYSDGGYVSTRQMVWQGGGQYLVPSPQEVKAGDTHVTNHHHNVTVQAAPGMSRATAKQLGAAAVQGGMEAARRNGKRV